jgi:hypothetical protein
MSYRTANYNRIFHNVLHDNNTLSGNLSGDNLASIDYVNTNIESIDLTTQKNELITLQNELITLQNEINILVEKNKRIIGSITPYFLFNPPINYLICNGQSLLVSQYQKLFNVISYNYGGSDLYFNLPDFRSYYILGGNNNINNLSFSNLFSGNGTTGGINNYLKFGSVFPSGFPLLTKMCNHIHIVNDNGHFHDGWSEDQPYATIGTEGFIKKANQDGNFNVGSSTTGLTLKSSGTDIQQIDSYSGLSGVNITSPFFSVNFLICYN